MRPARLPPPQEQQQQEEEGLLQGEGGGCERLPLAAAGSTSGLTDPLRVLLQRQWPLQEAAEEGGAASATWAAAAWQPPPRRSSAAETWGGCATRLLLGMRRPLMRHPLLGAMGSGA